MGNQSTRGVTMEETFVDYICTKDIYGSAEMQFAINGLSRMIRKLQEEGYTRFSDIKIFQEERSELAELNKLGWSVTASK